MRYLKFLCIITALLLAFLPLSASAAPSPLEKTVSAIENGNYTLNIYQINTKDGVYEYLGKYLEGFTESNVELIGVTVVDFYPAESNTKNGSFSFFAELSYSGVRKTTKTVDGIINRHPVIINASSSQSSIFAGDEFTLSVEISDFDGGSVYWYESSSPNRNGVLLEQTKTTHITVSPDIGTKYYTCIYKGSVSNTVSVKVTEAFVPVSDIILPSFALICNRSTLLPAEIYPEDSTKNDIVWKVTDGDASIISDRITAHSSGIITVKATVIGGGKKGGDYEKYFELYAEEGTPEYREVKWSILPTVDGINQMSFIANERKDIQITAVSPLTANKMINASDAHSEMEIITGAYIVCDDIKEINEITVQLDSDYIGKEVHIISSDDDGNTSHESLTVSDTGEIILPQHKSTYLIASAEASKTDLTFLVLFLPLIPLLIIPIFLRAAKDRESTKNKK